MLAENPLGVQKSGAGKKSVPDPFVKKVESFLQPHCRRSGEVGNLEKRGGPLLLLMVWKQEENPSIEPAAETAKHFFLPFFGDVIP